MRPETLIFLNILKYSERVPRPPLTTRNVHLEHQQAQGIKRKFLESLLKNPSTQIKDVSAVTETHSALTETHLKKVSDLARQYHT